MILVKTEKGQQVLKDRSIRISPRQRSAFILFDGKRSKDDVVNSGMGISAAEIEEMIELGLLMEVEGSPKALPPAQPNIAPVSEAEGKAQDAAGAPQGGSSAMPVLRQAAGSGRSKQQRYKDAYPIATRLSSSLGLRGFRLNLAVERTSTFEELLALAPKIRAAVGPEKAGELDRALND